MKNSDDLADLNSTVVGSTNVYTCVEDFLQWDKNFYENKLGTWEFSNAMTAQILLNNGDKCNYAFGLELSEHNGLKTISHQGGTEGFQAMYVQIPSEKFAVVCLFNTGIDVTGLAYKITDLYVKGTPHAENVSIQHEIAKVDSSILQKYVGNYFDESFWMDATITRETEHLFLMRLMLAGLKYILHQTHHFM